MGSKRVNVWYLIGVTALVCMAYMLYRFRHSLLDAAKVAGNKIKGSDMKWFTMDELCASSTAKAKGIDNTPNDVQKENLRQLAVNVLDPIREEYGYSIKVSSGFRCPELNTAVGGVKNSQHLTGQAADLVPGNNSGTLDDIFNAALKVGGYDQLIIEQNKKGSRWVHVSYNSGGNRGQVLSYNGSGYVDITRQVC